MFSATILPPTGSLNPSHSLCSLDRKPVVLVCTQDFCISQDHGEYQTAMMEPDAQAVAHVSPTHPTHPRIKKYCFVSNYTQVGYRHACFKFSFWKEKGRGTWISLSLRLSWSIYSVFGQQRPHSENLYQTTTTTKLCQTYKILCIEQNTKQSKTET